MVPLFGDGVTGDLDFSAFPFTTSIAVGRSDGRLRQSYSTSSWILS